MPIASTDTSAPTVGRFTHVMANEATQGIDPKTSLAGKAAAYQCEHAPNFCH